MLSIEKKTVGKVLKGLELAYRKDDKLTLIKLNFFMTGYKNLTSTEVSILSNTAQHFFHLVNSFGKNKKITIFVNVWMLQDPIQVEINQSTCEPFKIYFYENLFFPDENSKIYTYKKQTKIALERLLNERFTLDRDNNEHIINEYIRQRQIKMM